jgi:hypothetical protein
MREDGLSVITVALLFPLDAIIVDKIPNGTRTQIFFRVCKSVHHHTVVPTG